VKNPGQRPGLLPREKPALAFSRDLGIISTKGESAFDSRRIERAQQGEKRRIGEAL